MTKRRKSHPLTTGAAWLMAAVATLAFGLLERAPFRLAAVVLESLLVTPGYIQTVPGTHHYWDARNLEDRLKQYGWAVNYAPTPTGYFGITIPMTRTITIDENLSWDERYRTLAHEAGHTQQVNLTTAQGEVFAECVATLLTHDRLREHARYLSIYRADLWTAVIYWQDIYHAAAVYQ